MLVFLPLILAGLQALPSFVAAIQAVEQAITTAKAGAQKKAMVMAAVTPPGADPKLVEHLSTMVDAHVAAFNAAKVFKTSAAPAPAVETTVEKPTA